MVNEKSFLIYTNMFTCQNIYTVPSEVFLAFGTKNVEMTQPTW